MVNSASSPAERQDPVVRAAIAFLLLLSVVNICTFLTERLLDWEEYRLLEGVDAPLIDYLSVNLSYHGLSHWILYRVFHGEVLGLRIFSMATGVVAVIAASRVSQQILKNSTMVVVALGVFGLGWHFLDYARWGVAGYSAATPFYVVTFYLFWKVSDSTLDAAGKAAIVLVSAVGFFVLAHSAVAVVAGVLGVLVTHLLAFLPNRKPLWTKIKELAWFGVYLLAPLFMIPRMPEVGNVHAAKVYRSYLYFAHNRLYEPSIEGAVRFYVDRIYDLLYWLLRPIGGLGSEIAPILVVLLAIGVLGTFLKAKVHRARLFVAVYVLTSLLLLVVLNLFERYPLGSPRYAFFLFYPAALLVAYGVGDLASVPLYAFPKAGRTLARIAAAMLCILAVWLSIQEANRRLDAAKHVRLILAILHSEPDLVIIEDRYKALATTVVPELANCMIVLPNERRKDTEGLDAALAAVRHSRPRNVIFITRYWQLPRSREMLATMGYLGYERVSRVNLHGDGTYIAVFHKYNIYAVHWRRR